MTMRFVLAVMILFSVGLLPSFADREVVERKVFMRGRVLDPLSKPVGDAKILLRNADSGEIITETTSRKGEFSVEHPLCSHLSLEIVANEKTRLARAQYEKLTGRETKHMVIRLHHGFLVTGRVVSAAKGVRDLDIVVMPAAKHGGSSESINGGGLSRTGRDGTFRLVLTPGAKTLKIVNNERPDLPNVLEQKIVVTADSALPVIELKPQQPAAK